MSSDEERLFQEFRTLVHANQSSIADLMVRLTELENLLLAVQLWPQRVPRLPKSLFPNEPCQSEGGQGQARSFRQHQQE
jgi:hypothetical protein